MDDDPDVRELLCVALTEWGYECSEAGDTERAMALLNDEHFDLLLLDELMPNLRGHEFLGLLHAFLPPGELPRVVVVTGYVPTPLPGEPDVAADEAVTGIVHKPFDLAELLSAVRAAAAPSGTPAAPTQTGELSS